METPKIYGLWCGDTWMQKTNGDLIYALYPQVISGFLPSLGITRSIYKVCEIGLDGQPIALPNDLNLNSGTTSYGVWQEFDWMRTATGEIFHSQFSSVMQATIHSLEREINYPEFKGKMKVREIGADGLPVAEET